MARLAKGSIGVEQPEWHPGESGDYDYKQVMAAEEQAVEVAAAKAQAKHPGTMAGEVVAWPRADNYARYMIVSEKPLTLIHINTGDGYAIEAALIRGLRLADLRVMVDRDRAMRELFSGKGK